MAAKEADNLERVHTIMPELQVSSMRSGQDGLVNDVLIVNEEWVFRFARTDEGQRSLEREAQLLRLVSRHVSLRVPEVVHQTLACLVHRFIPGIPLTRQLLLALDARSRAMVMEQLGTFLHELHRIPLAPSEKSSQLTSREKLERLYEDLERELLPFMMAWAREWAREHFRLFYDGSLDLTYTPTFIHGDLAPYHLCYDTAAHQLVGVIDFGDAGAGDPAADLASAINAYGERLIWGMAPAYPALTQHIDRARFLAGTLELRWALAAIRSRDPAWFLCHLGYARDMLPVGWRGTPP